MHLVDKHSFPKEYDFYIVNDGIDQRKSMLRSGRHRRKSSAARQDRAQRQSSILSSSDNGLIGEENRAEDQDEMQEDEKEYSIAQAESIAPKGIDMDDLTSSMSAIKFVPPSIRFGRGKGRGIGGFSRS